MRKLIILLLMCASSVFAQTGSVTVDSSGNVIKPAAVNFPTPIPLKLNGVTINALPGNSKYWGTNGAGTFGYYSLPSSAVWGSITGTLSDQLDLQSALDAKVPTSRTLTIFGTTQDLSANRTFTTVGGFTAHFSRGGSVIQSNDVILTPWTCPYSGTITGYSISADSGTCTLKTWKKANGTAIPTITDVISTSGVSLATGTHIRSSTVSDFTTTTVTAGDMFMAQVTATSGPTDITFQVEITR